MALEFCMKFSRIFALAKTPTLTQYIVRERISPLSEGSEIAGDFEDTEA